MLRTLSGSQAKRICFILPCSVLDGSIGGAELQVMYIATEMKRRGWEVFYIREAPPGRATVEHDGLHYRGIPPRRHYLQPLNYLALRRLMAAIRADVWYCRASKGYVPLVVRHAQALGGKVIYACALDSDLGFVPVARTLAGRMAEWAVHQFFSWGVRRVDLALAQHGGQQENLAASYAVRSQVLPNGHPVPDWRDVPRQPVVLWVGNLRRFKRPMQFVDLARRWPDHATQFLMIGAPCEKDAAEPVQQAMCGVSNLRYLELQPVDVVNDQLWRATVLVNTSSAEGFPNTFVQAWMRGVPVVSMGIDPGGIIARHGLGRVSRSLEQMEWDVRAYLEDGQLWAETSRRVREYAVEHLGIGGHVDRLVRLIDSIDQGTESLVQ